MIPCRKDKEHLIKNVNEISFMLGEEKVPVVEEYKYLGYKFQLVSKVKLLSRQELLLEEGISYNLQSSCAI